jgi:hypothetical protein
MPRVADVTHYDVGSAVEEGTMADLAVGKVATPTGWRLTVTVTEGARQTRHEVTLDRATYQRLTGGQVPPEALVRESFAFLLEREPQESILRTFDLPMVGRYFPSYEPEIRRRLGLP